MLPAGIIVHVPTPDPQPERPGLTRQARQQLRALLAQQEVPGPVYAAIGAAAAARQQLGRLGDLPTRVQAGYAGFSRTGERVVTQKAAERAIDKRISETTTRVTPAMARAAVRAREARLRAQALRAQRQAARRRAPARTERSA